MHFVKLLNVILTKGCWNDNCLHHGRQCRLLLRARRESCSRVVAKTVLNLLGHDPCLMIVVNLLRTSSAAVALISSL